MLVHKLKIDLLLKEFGHKESVVEKDSPDCLYFNNGYSLQQEDREHVYPTLVGDRKETRPHYALA